MVGETERKVRALFADAEEDYRLNGENAQLHVIVLDEMDSVCKTRGSSRDGTGVSDNIVNQFLSKIDGVEALDNVLLTLGGCLGTAIRLSQCQKMDVSEC